MLATLVDMSRLRLRFKVSEAESLRAREGGRPSASAWRRSARATSARTVYHVGDVADPATRQVEVLAWVENPGELKPGFFAEVTLATETQQGRAGRPRERHPGERARLRRLRGEGAARRALRPVEIGLRTGDRRGRDPVRPQGRRDRGHRGLGPPRRRRGGRGRWRDRGPARRGRDASERRATPAARRAAGGPQADRHRHDARRHLDPQPRLRLDADVRPDRLRRSASPASAPSSRASASARTPTSTSRSSTSRVTCEGASPEIMETDVVDLLEDAVTSVEGVKQITSTSRQGPANITVEFELEPQHRRGAAGRADARSRRRAPPAARDRPADRSPRPTPRTSRSCGWRCPASRPPTFLADYVRNVIRPQLQTIAGVGEIHDRRLPRAQRARLVRRRAAGGAGPHRAGRQPRDRSASTWRCRPGASRAPSAR